MECSSEQTNAEQLLIRSALMADVPAIHRLVTFHAEYNRMLFRSYAYLYEHLRDFSVAVRTEGENHRVIACASLELIWRNLAEIKSLSVEEDCQGRGIGTHLVRTKLKEAKQLGVSRVFALTREKAFFEKLGFICVPRDSLPHKVWTDCIHCPLQMECDEIAMLVDLT